MKKKKDVCYSVYLDPVFAEVFEKCASDMCTSVNGLFKQILESQAEEFLESHPGFMDPAPDPEASDGE